MPRIAILVHQYDDCEHVGYFVKALAERWGAAGIETLWVHGPRAFVPADVALLHLDVTRVPRAYRRLARRYPRVINGRMLDISKRRISTQTLRPWDHYDAPVMVKSNRNFGGRPESVIAERWARGAVWRRAIVAARRQLPPTWRGEVDPTSYPVFPSLAAIPWRWRWNPHLALDRYRPEREGALYVLRQWVFFGEQEASSIAYATSPTVKAETIVRRESGGAPPPALRALRRRLGIDYGKVDWALVDGEVVVYDVNRTPTAAGRVLPHHQDIAEQLAQGLREFLP